MSPKSQQVNIKLPPDLFRRLKKLASAERRSVTQLARLILEDSITRREKQQQEAA